MYALTLKIMWSFKVALAQMEYQLPRLTRMWSHLERQAGGRVKGMGEKQIEVDKRILRTQVRNFSCTEFFSLDVSLFPIEHPILQCEVILFL